MHAGAVITLYRKYIMIDSERARLICAGVARHQAAFYLMYHKTLFEVDAISAEVGGVALVRGANLIIRTLRIIARCKWGYSRCTRDLHMHVAGRVIYDIPLRMLSVRI